MYSSAFSVIPQLFRNSLRVLAAFLAALLLALCFSPGAAAQKPSGAAQAVVQSAQFKIAPEKYSGVCPVTLNFSASISVSAPSGKGPSSVTYRWARSDGGTSAPQTATFSGANYVITGMWMLGRDYSGWVALELLSPAAPGVNLHKLPFSVQCAGAPAKPAPAQPPLLALSHAVQVTPPPAAAPLSKPAAPVQPAAPVAPVPSQVNSATTKPAQPPLLALSHAVQATPPPAAAPSSKPAAPVQLAAPVAPVPSQVNSQTTVPVVRPAETYVQVIQPTAMPAASPGTVVTSPGIASAVSVTAQGNRAAAFLNEPDWDFETGIHGWAAQGDAFREQPVYGDAMLAGRVNPRPVSLGGDYWSDTPYPLGHHLEMWIGTGEHHPDRSAPRSATTDDAATGTLTSAEFLLQNPFLTFLLGGGNDIQRIRVELQIKAPTAADRAGLAVVGTDGDFAIVLFATGNGIDLMRREVWDVSSFAGRTARIRIVDNSPSKHINVDDFRFPAADPRPQLLHVQIGGFGFFRDPDAAIWGFADPHTHPASNLGFGGLLYGSVGGNWNDTQRNAQDALACDGARHGGATPIAQVLTSALEPAALGYIPARLSPLTVLACVPALGMLPSTALEASPASGAMVVNPMLALTALRGYLTTPLSALLAPCGDSFLHDALQHYGGGSPGFEGWPRWDTTIHQSMQTMNIHRAYEGGLRLMTVLAVNTRLLEYLMRAKGAPLESDRAIIETQTAEMRRVVSENSDWMEIALTPADARRIIASNKLAIILGSEVDDIGSLGFPTAQAEVEWLYNLGIRQITPIHLVDNRLGGAALYNDLFASSNNFLHRSPDNIAGSGWPRVEEGCPDSSSADCVQFKLSSLQVFAEDAFLFGLPSQGVPFVNAAEIYPGVQSLGGHRNADGLTAYGEEYLDQLMSHGMIISVDHMGEKVLDRVLTLAEQRHYPVLSDHSGFRDLAWRAGATSAHGKLPHESLKKRADVQRIYALGGMTAPILIPDDNQAYATRDGLAVANDAPGSSRSWAQNYLYALDFAGRDGFVAMATDYTLLAKPSPRFGVDAGEALHGDTLRDPGGVRRAGAMNQAAGVKYDSPIHEYRYHRFRSTTLYSMEERDMWEAIAAYWANVSPQQMYDEAPRSLFERTPIQQNKIVNLRRGLGVTDSNSEEATGRHGIILPGDASFYERRAGYLVSHTALGSAPALVADDGEEVRRLYGVMRPIYELALRMQEGTGADQPALLRSVFQGRDFDYNLDGLAHYGMLPDFIQDLHNIGITGEALYPLLRSSEGYVRMWERDAAAATPH